MRQPRASAPGTVQIALRLPETLRDRVREYADAENTSINSVIVRVLNENIPHFSDLSRALSDLQEACNQLASVTNDSEIAYWIDERDDALKRVNEFISQSNPD